MSNPSPLRDRLESLGKAIGSDPESVERLKLAKDPAQVVDIVTGLADRHGVALDANELRRLLDHLAATTHDLGDDDLEHVAGGGVGSAVVFSLVGGLGIACAVGSLVGFILIPKDGCEQMLTKTLGDW